VNETTTNTTNIADSYNTTTSRVNTASNVGNTLVQFGLPGLDASSVVSDFFGGEDSGEGGGISPVLLALGAAALVALFLFFKR